jgi:hypothetical protein
MKFNQTPHPTIEDHYHIQELINGQEKRSAQRTYHQNVEKDRDAFEKYVASIPDMTLVDFWCAECKKDFIARVRKEVDSWGHFAFYRTKHKCGKWAIRHITDRFNDKYWFKSRNVANDRAVHHNDLLQEFETGYNTLYGKK